MSNVIVNMQFDENGFHDLTGKVWQDYNVTYEEPGVFGGRCAYFNGTSKILAEADEKLSFGTNDFTFSCWMKRSAQKVAGLIGETTSGYSSGLILTGISGKSLLPPAIVVNNTWQSALLGQNLAPADSQWHHIALVRKDGVFRVFIDGKIIIEDKNSAFINANYDLGKKGTILGDTGYGGSNNYHGYVGYLDDVVITGEALWTEEFEPPTDNLGNEKDDDKECNCKGIMGYIPVYLCEDDCVGSSNKCFKFISCEKTDCKK